MSALPAWTAGLHHDGSSLYVSNPLPKADEIVTISLRAPIDAPIKAIFLRTAPDGENHLERMTVVDHDSVCAAWAGKLPATMPVNTYRFKIITDHGTFYLNALGVSRADSPDYYDFKLLTDYAAPEWVNDSVFYQIFPDRFHNGDPALTVKPGAWTKREHAVQVREWGAPPLPYAQAGNIDFYGGDLPGIAQKLDYLQALGVNALYLTPIFASKSNHRYNIDDFFNVDEHLGGNEALVQLRQALDERGMKLMLDVTPNHTSSTHPWFLEAQQNPDAPSAEFYTFYDRPDDYAMWLGVKSLPKLNYRSEKLRRMMYEAPDSVLRFWLAEPYRIDGWRLDVLNMTARQGQAQLGNKIGRAIRRAIKGDNPQAYLLGEHWFDATPHLQGNELDATMNYQGFNILMWRWLAGFDGSAWQPEARDPNLFPSEAVAEQMQRYLAAVPWVIARQQFNQLCSHDTRRILSIVGGNKILLKLGLAVLMTFPGVPCVYYGDEVGLAGEGDPDNRRTMPWDESEWDQDLLSYYQQMIKIRRSCHALIHGGYQLLMAEGGILAYQRQSTEQRIVVVAYRGPGDLMAGELPVRHAGLPDGAKLTDLVSGASFEVHEGKLSLGSLPQATALILEVE